MRGNWYRWRDIPVMVTYHPSYLLRAYNQSAKREAWEDLKKVLHYRLRLKLAQHVVLTQETQR